MSRFAELRFRGKALGFDRPGFWRPLQRPGSTLGEIVGTLEFLGARLLVRTPLQARDRAVADVCPAGWVDAKMIAIHLALSGQAEVAQVAVVSGLAVKAPCDGRAYRSVKPGAPPLAQVGDVLEAGAAVAVLEVMKTFQTVRWEGPRARLERFHFDDGADMESGAVLASLNAVS